MELPLAGDGVLFGQNWTSASSSVAEVPGLVLLKTSIGCPLSIEAPATCSMFHHTSVLSHVDGGVYEEDCKASPGAVQ
jgi:hypothetical protein